MVGWLVREKTLKAFGWLVGWADRREGEKDGVARKGEEVTRKGVEASLPCRLAQGRIHKEEREQSFFNKKIIGIIKYSTL